MTSTFEVIRKVIKIGQLSLTTWFVFVFHMLPIRKLKKRGSEGKKLICGAKKQEVIKKDKMQLKTLAINKFLKLEFNIYVLFLLLNSIPFISYKIVWMFFCIQ